MQDILRSPAVQTLVRLALEEDLGVHGDVTCQVLIPETAVLKGVLASRRHGVLAGLPLAQALFAQVGVEVQALARDGDALSPGQVLARVAGPAREVLRIERPALNFLQRLSGVATRTRRFAEKLLPSKTKLYDTRKTTPGWRDLEKYAVRMGGGYNHRRDLSELGMVKDNHLGLLAARHPEWPRSEVFKRMLELWRDRAPAGVELEVEVDSIEDLKHALAAGFRLILLDNMSDAELSQCVAIRNATKGAEGAILEASGGIDEARLSTIKDVGVDRISVGSLTHSATALDLGLDIETLTET